MALNVDWPFAQSLFQEGVSLRGISTRTGIPYQALHKHAKRYNWQVLSLNSPAPARPAKTQTEYHPPCPPIVPGQIAKWQSRILETASRHLDTIFDKSTNEVDIDTLEKLVRVLNATDLTARRTLGLDVQNSHVTLHVQSELSPGSGHAKQLSQGEIVDVETVPEQKPAESASQYQKPVSD